MKRKTPNEIYRELPCSVVAIGCALGLTDKEEVRTILEAAKSGEYGSKLREDGYLSLNGMDGLIRANMAVTRREDCKRGRRPLLRDFAHSHIGQRTIICVLGHFIYFDGRDYHSFLWNGGDPVVTAWYLDN